MTDWGAWVISRLARISLSIQTITIQEIRPIVEINAAVFICDAIVGIGLCRLRHSSLGYVG